MLGRHSGGGPVRFQVSLEEGGTVTAIAQGGGGKGRKPKSGISFREQLSNFSFTVPALALMAVFLFYPIVYVIWLSFQKWNLLGAPKFIGLDNYSTILTGPSQPDFFHSVFVSIIFVVLAMPAQIALGLVLAVLLERELRGRAFFRSIFFFPMVVSFVAAGVTFTWLFDPTNGYFPSLLEHLPFGLSITLPDWKHDSTWGVVFVVLMNTWKVVGFSMILYIAGLQGINAELYEAAEIDGARTTWQRFKHISWPLLIPTTTLLVITNTIGSFQAFVPFYVMTQGGPAGETRTIVYFIYNTYLNRTGIACAAATLFLIFVLIITAIQLRATRSSENIY
jgi:multiple sugar transport system permease protein